ncbi:hypothetical protein FRC09_014804 [Ceratobasidium sp. 395]|nr:hypothetical protein FRC09_014804 [Ceratobasidium sp. 395]
MNERFETPSEHKDFAGLAISSSLLQDLSAFRVPPRVEKHSDGQVVYAGDDTGGLESPHSGSASLDTDHESPVTTSSTYEPPEVLTLPPIILPDDYTFDLPPLRPLPSRSHTAWENAPMLSPCAYESSPYSSQGRSDQPSYSFSSNSAPSFTTLPAPSLTPPPTRPVPRLRDGRQHPYPQRSAGIVRGYREAEHAPSATSAMGAEESPSYSQSPGLWAIPPSREGTATPVLIRPSLAAYEVGPSGETVEYDAPEGRWTPNSGLSPMYSGTHGARY